jgi:chromosome partitioning protein
MARSSSSSGRRSNSKRSAPPNTPPQVAEKARVIAIANFKGGVGKTTTAVNLAGAFILREKRVLLVDLDSQCNASTALNITISTNNLGTRYLLQDDTYPASDCTYSRGPFLDVIPADPDLVELEQKLLVAPEGRLRLREKLEKEIRQYDYVLLDCPPSVGALTQCALVAATDVIIPVDVGFFSVDGLVRMLSIIKQICKAYNPQLTLAGILATKFDGRTTLSEQTAQMILDQGLPLFATKVRISVDIIRAQMARSPVSIFAPGSHGDADYQALAEELLPAKVIPLRQRKRAQ